MRHLAAIRNHLHVNSPFEFVSLLLLIILKFHYRLFLELLSPFDLLSHLIMSPLWSKGPQLHFYCLFSPVFFSASLRKPNPSPLMSGHCITLGPTVFKGSGKNSMHRCNNFITLHRLTTGEFLWVGLVKRTDY